MTTLPEDITASPPNYPAGAHAAHHNTLHEFYNDPGSLLNGTYERKRTRLYDLRDYGLTAGTGSGLKAAIEAALTDLDSDGGGVVYIPGGTYLYDGWTEAEAEAVDAYDDVTFVGDGMGTVLRLNLAAPSNPVLLPIRGSKISVERIRFDTQAISNSTAVRVIGGSDGVRIESCSFDSPGSGGIYLNDGAVANVVISNNDFTGSRYAIATSFTAEIANVAIVGNTITGDAGGIGIDIDTPNGTAFDVTIVGNTVRDVATSGASNGIGIAVAHAERVTVTGNTVNNCGLDGIHVEDSSHDVVVSGNTVYDCGRSGIVVSYAVGVSTDTDRTSQVTIMGNTIRACGTVSGTGGLAIESNAGDATSADYIIVGNTVRGCGRTGVDYAGILIGFQSTRSTVAHNHVSNTVGDTNTAGIQVTSADALVTGNTLVDDQGGTATQKYGIRVSGSIAVVRIRDNKYSGNVTAETIVSSGTMIDLNQLPAVDQHALAAGASTLNRAVGGQSTTLAVTSNTLRIAYFTALRTETVSQVKVRTGGTAAGATPTTVQLGLMSVNSAGGLTKLTETANDTTLLASTSTMYTKAFGVSVQLQVGQRYAVALLVTTAAATPTLTGASLLVDSTTLPWMGASYASAGTIPSSIGVGALAGSGNVPYFAVIP